MRGEKRKAVFEETDRAYKRAKADEDEVARLLRVGLLVHALIGLEEVLLVIIRQIVRRISEACPREILNVWSSSL